MLPKTMIGLYNGEASTSSFRCRVITIPIFYIYIPFFNLMCIIYLLLVVYGDGYGAIRHFQQYFSYIVAVRFIGGGNRSTRRKPPT
jgi:hypothetical protein